MPMSDHRTTNSHRNRRTFWEVLAPAPVITRRRASRMTPAPERMPSMARMAALAVVAVGAFVVQATRLWQMVP
jgi:hypothetical protein